MVINHLLNIDNIHFEQVVHRIYHAELLIPKQHSSLDLNISIDNDTVSKKKKNKLDDFDFDIEFPVYRW